MLKMQNFGDDPCSSDGSSHLQQALKNMYGLSGWADWATPLSLEKENSAYLE